MGEEMHTTAAVQGYLDQLGAAPSEEAVRALLERAAGRLHMLCGALLHRGYPRLTRPPLNLQTEEMLSAVVERLLKALRDVRPATVRAFFALANRHMRWELNDLARRLDEQTRAIGAAADHIPDPYGDPAATGTGTGLSPDAIRILEAIEALPDDERETFDLIRIQGMTHPEAAELLGVSTKTIQRRLHRGLLLLSEQLGDLRPAALEPAPDATPDQHTPS